MSAIGSSFGNQNSTNTLPGTGYSRKIPTMLQNDPKGPQILPPKMLGNIISILPLSDYSSFARVCKGFNAIQLRETELKDVKINSELADKAFYLLAKCHFFSTPSQLSPLTYHSNRWDREVFEERQLEALQIFADIANQNFAQNKLNQANVETLESLRCAIDFADPSLSLGDAFSKAALDRGIVIPPDFTVYQNLAFVLADEIVQLKRFSAKAEKINDIMDRLIKGSGVEGLSKEKLLDTYLKTTLIKPALSHLYFVLKSINDNEQWVDSKLRLTLRNLIYRNFDPTTTYETLNATAWFGKGEISGTPEHNAKHPYGIHVFPKAIQEAFIHYTTQVLNSGKTGLRIGSDDTGILSPKCAVDIMKLLQGMEKLQYLSFHGLVDHTSSDWTFSDEHVPAIIEFMKNTPDLKTFDISIIIRNPENKKLLQDAIAETGVQNLKFN